MCCQALVLHIVEHDISNKDEIAIYARAMNLIEDLIVKEEPLLGFAAKPTFSKHS